MVCSSKSGWVGWLRAILQANSKIPFKLKCSRDWRTGFSIRGCSTERLWGSHPKSPSLFQGISKKSRFTSPASHDPSSQVSRQFQRGEPCPETCKKITGVHLWNEVDVNSFLCAGNPFVFRGTKCIWDILKNPLSVSTQWLVVCIKSFLHASS